MATKTRRRTPPGEPAYHRLTDEKRIQMETLVKLGHTQRQIAAILGVAPSTICREKEPGAGRSRGAWTSASARRPWKAGRGADTARET